MKIDLSNNTSKKEVFIAVEEFLKNNHLKIINKDETRPWGGFYVIDESQSQEFIDLFFKDVPTNQVSTSGKLSPKILIVEGNKRLSWQYHHRRSEIWKLIYGQAGVVTSDTDEEGTVQEKKPNDIIILKKGERHRLVGTEGWGIIAEIWQHTDPSQPSDEDDIVRVQDDFGR